MNRYVGIGLLSLVVGVLSLPCGALRGEDSTDQQYPEDLERELTNLVMEGAAHSTDLTRLLRLAGLYLDLGYGVYVGREQKLAAFQEGARVAQKALNLRESSADAHFLYAANLGSAAELEGLVAAALTIQELKDHVHRVLELDERNAQAHHMLGRMYEELPWVLGGDQEAAGDHLKKAVSLDNQYAPAGLDLARWYMKHGQSREAVRELTRVVDTPPLVKRWIWERMHRPEAQALLRQLASLEGTARSSGHP
ncbi:MAG: TRAP transporter TatT component family protein [Nitrospirota bacterium]|nr:TRAP transporter TatT component family protein [Nitrospirota bacterium]MDH5698352.1 TRAP transporter TatT component family protein [Nitrospirota bacterium]